MDENITTETGAETSEYDAIRADLSGSGADADLAGGSAEAPEPESAEPEVETETTQTEEEAAEAQTATLTEADIARLKREFGIADREEPAVEDAPADATFLSSWQELKGEIEAHWEEVDAPGERILVGVIDKLVGEIETLKAQITPVIVQTEQQAAMDAMNKVNEGAQILKSEFGVDISPEDLTTFLTSRGLHAYAALHGLDISQVQFSAQVVRDAYLMANPTVLANQVKNTARPDTRAQSTRKSGIAGEPPIDRSKLSERELIELDIREAQALSGRG